MRVHGSCRCEAVRYEADVDPERTAICHCTDCQKLAGSAYRVSVPAPPGTFKLLHGPRRSSSSVVTAGPGARRPSVGAVDARSTRMTRTAPPSSACGSAASRSASGWSRASRSGAARRWAGPRAWRGWTASEANDAAVANSLCACWVCTNKPLVGRYCRSTGGPCWICAAIVSNSGCIASGSKSRATHVIGHPPVGALDEQRRRGSACPAGRSLKRHTTFAHGSLA